MITGQQKNIRLWENIRIWEGKNCFGGLAYLNVQRCVNESYRYFVLYDGKSNRIYYSVDNVKIAMRRFYGQREKNN